MATKPESKKFEVLLDLLPQIMFVTDIGGSAAQLNRHWFDYTGHPFSESVPDDWHRYIHPEDIKSMGSVIQKARADRLAWTYSYRLLRHDGEYRWHLARSIPRYSEGGEFLNWIGTATDIEDQKRAEETLRSANERSKFLSRASALLGSSLDYETTLKELANLSVPDLADLCAIQLIQSNGDLKPVVIVQRDDDQAPLTKEIHAKFSTQLEAGAVATFKSGETQIRNHISTERLKQVAYSPEHLDYLLKLSPFSYISAPIRIGEKIIGVLTFVSTTASRRVYQEHDRLLVEDLGQRAGFAVENARLYKDAKSLNRVKDEFLATLSHELRTPLNVILGYAEILNAEGATLPKDELLSSTDAILRNARAQMTIVSDLLDVSSIITGKISFSPLPLNLPDLVRQTVDSMRPLAETKQIQLIFESAGPASTIQGDAVRLQQVMANLISNALKFTPVGGKIEVRVSRENDQSLISVSDNGRGMESDFLPFVFDRFRQEDSSTSRRHGGLGLGLSIVRNLVELHGGSVKVESAGLNQGSTFTLTLPIRTGHLSEKPASPARASRSLENRRFDGKTILLVEDSSDNRQLIRRLLTKTGATILEAASAKEARLLLTNQMPDLIISDIGMAEENGLEFMRRVRGTMSSDQLPAIALTAYVRYEEIDAVMDAGFQAHVGKPLAIGDLTRAIAHLIR